MRSVIFVSRILTHYRAPFHELVREKLAAAGVDYRLVHSTGSRQELGKGDAVALDWAEIVDIRYFGAGNASWLMLPDLSSADLVVIGQENGNLNNYAIQLARWFGGPKVAFFGHGRNFQARTTNSRAELFKRFWLPLVDWWFAYTERSARIVAGAGFPIERITVFQNAVDISAIANERAKVDRGEQRLFQNERLLGSYHIGVYIGGLYDMKRIPFLLQAAQEIRARLPDFQLLVIGGGPEWHLVQQAAATHSWIHALGPRFGAEKTFLASLGRALLMPGLVGLGVLDSFAYGTPMVTTNLPYHSPEIDYLKDGVNGVIVEDPESVDLYAAAVVRVLTDDDWRSRLQAGATEALQVYTIEAMAQRFASGVIKAISQSTP